jgi:hypothetical protein
VSSSQKDDNESVNNQSFASNKDKKGQTSEVEDADSGSDSNDSMELQRFDSEVCLPKGKKNFAETRLIFFKQQSTK